MVVTGGEHTSYHRPFPFSIVPETLQIDIGRVPIKDTNRARDVSRFCRHRTKFALAWMNTKFHKILNLHSLGSEEALR